MNKCSFKFASQKTIPMLNHVALSLTDSEEIENFYKEILLFSIDHKFTMNSLISQKIFNIKNPTDVYVMRYEDVVFEIFISMLKEKKVFSHTCLSYHNPEVIYNKANKSGYRTEIREGQDHSTWFIWDKSGNMFEIKGIQN